MMEFEMENMKAMINDVLKIAVETSKKVETVKPSQVSSIDEASGGGEQAVECSNVQQPASTEKANLNTFAKVVASGAKPAGVGMVCTQGGMRKALRVPGIAVAAFSIVSASCSIGFIQALMEPHLRPFNLKPIVLGLMFVINGAVYALCAPVWGWLCDHHLRPKMATAVSAVLVTVGFSLLGPAPFLPITPSLGLISAALVIHGVGFGGEVVAAFVDAHREAVYNGFPDNLDTYSMVSGLWTSMFALGAFIGPSLAGILYDNFGFGYATLMVIVMHAVLLVVVLVFLCTQRRRAFQELQSAQEKGQPPEHEKLPLLTGSFDSSYGSEGSGSSSELVVW